LKLNGYTIDHQSDLAGANLSGLEIIDADLSHSILAGANLAGSRAINVNWEGVSLERSNLVKVDFRGEDLQGVDFRHADLSGADLSEANLKGANLAFTNLTNADFRKADLQGVCFDYSHMERTDFTNAQFHGYVELPEIEIEKRLHFITPTTPQPEEVTAWQHSKRKIDQDWILESHDFCIQETKRFLGRATFNGARAHFTTFDGARMGRCDCHGKDPYYRNREAKACRPLLANCTLNYCSLRHTDLQGVQNIMARHCNDFTGANLRRASIILCSYNLSSIGLRKNIFTEADLLSANIHHLIINKWSDPSGVHYSTNDGQFSGAYINDLRVYRSKLRTFHQNYNPNALPYSYNENDVQETSLDNHLANELREMLSIN